MMAVNIYVPADSLSIALGADDVAERIAEKITKKEKQPSSGNFNIVRNGTRGLFLVRNLS